MDSSTDSLQTYSELTQSIIEEITQFKTNKESEQRTNHFYQFLLKFDYLLISIDKSELKRETIFEFCNTIFENIEISLQSLTSAQKTGNIILNIIKIFQPNFLPNFSQNASANIKVSAYSIKMILKSCCEFYKQCPEIYKTFQPFLSSIFSKEDFFTKLAKSNIYEFILSDILFVMKYHDYAVFIFDICFVIPKPSFFVSIPMNSFTTFFVSSINGNKIEQDSKEITAQFVATLVSKVANVLKGSLSLFDQLGGFDAFDELISNFPQKDQPNYYSIFMVSDCEPSLIDHLLSLYQKSGNDEQTYFEMVSQKLRTQPELIQKCQIEKWFEMKNPDLNHLFAFFKFINQNDQQLSALSLPYLLKSLSKIELEFNMANELMKIVQKLIKKNFTTLEKLSKMDFLNVFFFHTKQDAFLELINVQKYLQIFISIYFLSNDSQQISFFSKICANISQIEKENFISICTKLILKSYVDNMKTLLNALSQYKDCSYITILLNSFLNSEQNKDLFYEVYAESSSESYSETDYILVPKFSFDFINCQRNFILADGIEWIFSSTFLDIKSIVLLISHLVAYRSYEQLEEKIKSLDQEKHPLFSVDEESMLNMVYGLTSPTNNIDFYYRPIRIRSLFIYLKQKQEILNPYNVFYLGKDFIDSNLKNSNIYSIPYIRSFGNRCISQKHIPLLFEHPENLIDFCDKNEDHFPFYMLFNNSFPLMFNVSYSSSIAFSFWFKVEQKKNEEKSKMSLLFQSDNGIRIYSYQKKIHVSIETSRSNEFPDSIETEFDSTVWNHVFISVSSSYSFGSNFSIIINSNVISTKIKRKLNQISKIFFVNPNPNTILYVSPSICVFYNYQRNSNLVNELFSKGPSSFSLIDNSSIVSPSVKISIRNSINSLTIKKKPIIKKKNENEIVFNFGVHFDIYLIPYLGFLKHPASQDLIIANIKECDSLELYEKLIKIFLLMTELNPNLLSENDLLELMKDSKQKPSYELFIAILQRQINIFGSMKELLTKIIFDSELWSIFDCVFILKALFELFPIDIWASDTIFVTFITHSLLSNSDKPEFAQIIVSHLVELPVLMKYVASLIKVAPVLSRLNPVWNQIEFRENSITQEVLINSLIPVINKDNYNFFKSYLPFNEIKSLFIVSSDSLCSSIYALITQFSLVRMSMNKENDYFIFDFVFLSKFMQLSHMKKVWNSALEMNHLPSLLSLILSASIAFTYYYSNIDLYNRYQVSSQESTNEQKNKIEKLIKEDINGVMNDAISSCIQSSSKIMNDSICLKIISVFYPYIFTYPSLFSNYQNLNNSSQAEPIILNVNQFSDIDDDLWIEKYYILSRFNFPPSQNPLSCFSFVNQIVSSVLRNFGFPMPFSFKSYDHLIESTGDQKSKNLLDLISWFTQSSLLDLMFSIISNCSVQFLDSFLYSIVSSDHNNSLLSTLVHGLLIRTPTNSIEKVLIILDFVSILSSFQLLNQNAIILMADLFAVFNLVQTKFGDKEAGIVATRIQPVLISLLNSIPFSEIKMLFSLLSNNVKSFSFFIESTRSLHSWLYSFIAFSLNEIEVYNDFINKVKSITKFSEADLSIMEKISKRTIQKHVDELKEIEKEWKELTNNFRIFAQSQFHKIQDENNRISKEFNQISIDYNYFRYYTNVKHFLLSFFVCQNIRYFEVTSSLYKEHFEWKYLMRKIRKDFLQFKPKYRLKYNFSWPYHEKHSDSKSIMIQSIFNDIIVEQKKVQTIKSEVIKTFKKIIKFQYVFINDIPLNLFNLFKEKYGNPDSFSNSIMFLQNYEIPCVIMLYDKKIMVLTYANIRALPGKTINSGSSMSNPMTSLSISGDNNFFFLKEKDTFELNCFYQNAVSGNLGPVDLFASHILITINIDSLISIRWVDKLRFKLWSIIDGFFEFQLSNKINIKYKDNFAFNVAPTKEEIFQLWVRRQISTNDMFDQLNQMTDSKEEPFVMKREDNTEKEEDYSVIHEHLLTYFNESFFSRGNVVKRDKKRPLFYAPFASPINFISRSSISYLYSPFLNSIYFRGQNIIAVSTKKICCSCLFFIAQIDIIKCMLTIGGHQIENQPFNTTSVYIKKIRSKFRFATHISVSSNGVFISIDYSFGVTEIYRIKNRKRGSYSSLVSMQNFYTSSIPYQIKEIVHFSNEYFKDNNDTEENNNHSCFSPNYSLISDRDMICVLFYGKKIIMLNIINGFAINQIMMPSEITAIAIDEFNSSIIVAMKKNGIQVISNSFISQNDYTIDEHPISFSLFNKDIVTAICVVQNRNREVMRTVICGTESGKILLLYYDDKGVDIRPVNSKHMKRIVKIEIDPENRSFISIDADDVAFIWSKDRNENFVVEVDN